MKVTLITACRNSSATVRDALESAAAQRLGDVRLEHIVVDGGSTDGTVEVIRDFAARHAADDSAGYGFKWISELDDGLYDALNKGIAMATGDVVGILNADDVLADAEVIAKIAAAFGAEGPDSPECVYGNVRFVHRLGGPTVRVCFARLWRPWMLQWGYMPPHPGVFIRRECFGKWGGYVSDRSLYRIAADCELLIRFFRVHRMRARYVKLCTTVMRTGGMSTRDARARLQLNAEVIRANRANGYFCCWPMLFPKYAVKIWEYRWP